MIPSSRLLASAREIADRLTDIRRDIHRHPELSGEEHRTAELVERELKDLGLETKRMAGTGVVALIEGRGDGPCVGLRADMDALPIQDQKCGDLHSEVPGVMHACGHDAHTSCLLGAAMLLVGERENFSGSIKLAFQPAEENGGGAFPLIQKGFLESPKVLAMFGQHTHSALDAGKISACSGGTYAASDGFCATFKGRGGHGAYPHVTRDVLLAACRAVDAIQSIVSREISPLDSAVVTVGSFHAGKAPNVIPSSAEFSGTIRTLSEASRELVTRRVREVIEATAAMHCVDVEYTERHGYAPVVNDDAMTDLVLAVGREMIGEENVELAGRAMSSEDFGFFAREVPSCYFNLGVMNKARGIDHAPHTPLFDVDEAALPIGAAMLAAVALRALERFSK